MHRGVSPCSVYALMTNSRQLLENCACTRVLTAARLMTRAYDEALQPSGVTAAQLAILAAVDADETSSIAELSKRLSMDRTTLSRNLKPLEKARWIRLGAEGWKRSKTVHLTSEGRERLAVGPDAEDGVVGAGVVLGEDRDPDGLTPAGPSRGRGRASRVGATGAGSS